MITAPLLRLVIEPGIFALCLLLMGGVLWNAAWSFANVLRVLAEARFAEANRVLARTIHQAILNGKIRGRV